MSKTAHGGKLGHGLETSASRPCVQTPGQEMPRAPPSLSLLQHPGIWTCIGMALRAAAGLGIVRRTSRGKLQIRT